MQCISCFPGIIFVLCLIMSNKYVFEQLRVSGLIIVYCFEIEDKTVLYLILLTASVFHVCRSKETAV